jgi:tetratricopeptide (TPR) repeat protein
MKAAISLVMIVKNEAANLPACLDSVNGQVDELIIVDTGSTDGTCAIARQYTDRIYHFTWCDDFSAARNFAIGKATGDWILSLDADEELISSAGDLRGLAAKDAQGAYLLPIDIPFPDGSGRYNRSLALRFFKNRDRYRYRGKLHEAVHDAENGLVGVAPGPIIRHKMVTPRESNRKRGRNLAVLKKVCREDTQDYFLRYCLGLEWMALGKPEQALPHLRQACQNLVGASPLYHTAALTQLINCLKVLGRQEEAMAVCREAAQGDFGYADILYLCGLLYFEEKNYHGALEWFERAVECGVPPPLYSHQAGTESFLALHSMGYCHQLLGCPEQALQCYRRALDANPDCISPAGDLFMLLCAGCGPGQTLRYFTEEGLLAHRGIALTVGDLFFTWGYPGLARRCLAIFLNGREADEVLLLNLAKYSILSGKFHEGRAFLSAVPEKSSLYPDALLYGAIALLLTGRHREARDRALALWKKRDRVMALLLLKLARFMEKGGDICCPGAVAGEDVTAAAGKLYADCCLYLPDGPDYTAPGVFKLLTGLETVLKGSSRGFLFLIQYYRAKYHRGEQLLNYRTNFGQKIKLGNALQPGVNS